MDFIKKNIGKISRNKTTYINNNVSIGSVGGSVLKGNYLPADFDEDGNYIVNLSKVTFAGNIIAEGQVSAYGAAEEGTGTTTNVDIIDNLTSTRTDAALSANQGRILKDLIDTKTSVSSWEDITDKPSVFPPSTHTHNISDITDFPSSWSWNNITGKPTNLSGYGITDAYKIIAGDPDNNKGMCTGYYANVGSYASFVQNNFGGQLSFGAGGILKYRGINNNYAGEWKTILDSSNYSSTLDNRYLLKSTYTANDILEKLKTVDGADSGLDADTLDGYEASKFYANGYVMFGHTIDATSLNENTYYPVTFYLGSSRNVRIECFVSLSSNSKPSWATHQAGFSVKKIWETNGNAWGTINVTRRILASDYLHATSDPVRGLGQMLNSSNEYVYVRGGGRYFFYVSNNITPVLRTSAYTASQETISPTTSAPAEIVRNVAFKTDTVAAADKLTTNAGSNTNPIYFKNGIPVASNYVFANGSNNIPISNGTLCTNLNADKVDGVDVTVNSSATGIKKLYVFNYVGNQNTYIKLGTLPTVASTGSGTSKAKFRIYGGINFGGREEATWEVIASTRSAIYVNSTLINGAKQLKVGYVSTSSGVEIWAALDDNYCTKTAIEIEVSEAFTVAMTRQTTKPSGFTEGSYRILADTEDNVASATKLQTARSIWGKSFDGTSNVDGLISITQNGNTVQIGSQNTNFCHLYNSANIPFIFNNSVMTTSGSLGSSKYKFTNLFLNGNITGVSNLKTTAGTGGRYWEITDGGSIIAHGANSGWVMGMVAHGYNGNVLGNSAASYGNIDTLFYHYYGGSYTSPHMVILPNGYVGIGTTAPTQKLTVSGNILATGAITAQAASDARLKDIVKTKKTYQQRLLELGNIVDFTYNTTAKERNKNAVDDKKHIGLIYQNAVKSELNNFCFKDEKDGFGSINYLSTDYINLIAGALQESIKEIKKLKREINKLKQAQNEENNKMVS